MNAVARPVRCGRCGASYSAHAYAALEQVMTLEQDGLGAVVVDWPKEVKVHVRACKSCARPIACLVRPSA